MVVFGEVEVQWQISSRRNHGCDIEYYFEVEFMCLTVLQNHTWWDCVLLESASSCR